MLRVSFKAYFIQCFSTQLSLPRILSFNTYMDQIVDKLLDGMD